MDNRSNILLVGNTTQGINLGGGANVYKSKAGGNLLQFRTISSTGASIQIFQVGDKILVSGATGGSGSGIGWSNLTSGSTVAGCGTITNVTSRCNSFFGVQAGANTVICDVYGCQNTAVGYRALWQNVCGFRNIAIGSTALQANTNGDSNIAIGSPAQLRTTTGQNNVAIGNYSLHWNCTGSDNVAVGVLALNAVRCSRNIGIGCGALWNNATGNNNIAIGTGAFQNLTGGTGSNVAIGHCAGNAVTFASNKLYIANSSACNLIYGEFDNKMVRICGSMCITNLPARGLETCGIYIDAAGKLSTGVISGGTGGGTITGGANGLSTSGANIVLGGTLTGNTSIAAENYCFNLYSSTNTGKGGLCLTLSENRLSFSGITGSSIIALQPSCISITNAKAGCVAGITLTNANCRVSFNSGGAYRACLTGTGFYYNADYSGTGGNNPRWIPDAAWVTGHTGSGSGIGWSNLLGGSTVAGCGTIASGTSIYNTFYGVCAGAKTTNGVGNIAVGYLAFSANTTGDGNTALGCRALKCNTDGCLNIAIGGDALGCNTTGIQNIAIGEKALCCNTTGGFNVAVGINNLAKNNADCNTAMGFSVLAANTSGVGNVGLGYQALTANLTGSWNIGIGQCGLGFEKSGTYNIAIGYNSLLTHTGGTGNVAIGRGTLGGNIAGSCNVAIGYCAGNTETGSNKLYIANSPTRSLIYGEFDNEHLCIRGQTFISGLTNASKANVIFYDTSTKELSYATAPAGSGAVTGATNLGSGNGTIYTTLNNNKIQLKTLSGGTNITLTTNGNYIGINATGGGSGIGWSNLAGGSTVAGCGTLASSGSILCNTYYGVSAGTNTTTTGCNNTGIGFAALHNNTTGCGNVAIGYLAVSGNSTGTDIIGIGTCAAFASTLGNNIGIGLCALRANSGGNDNIAIGRCAQSTCPYGYYSIAIGSWALYNNGGNNNIALGCQTLCALTSGSESIGIGVKAGFSNVSGSRNVFLGRCAAYNETGSDKLYIANSATKSLIYGEFDTEKLCIRGKTYISGLTNATKSNAVFYDTATNELTYATASSGGGIAWTGSTANGVATYANSSKACSNPNMTFNGICLVVTGCACATSNMYAADFQLTSDARLKTNIQSISIAPVNVDYKQFELISNPGHLRYGVIAQELLCENPELVGTGDNGMLSVSYTDLLVREIASLKCRVAELEKRLK